ncbi:MAG: hypothetical protein ABIA59_00330 [Candidatus Latescibacterota bacterium]
MGIPGKEHQSGGDAHAYTPEYLELERKKRYGFVNQMNETETSYAIKLHFPSIIPPSALGTSIGLSGEMPDYTYDVQLEEGVLTVKGRLTDEKVLALTGVLNSFPDRFYKEFVFDKPVSRFDTTYQDKILNIIVHKA